MKFHEILRGAAAMIEERGLSIHATARCKDGMAVTIDDPAAAQFSVDAAIYIAAGEGGEQAAMEVRCLLKKRLFGGNGSLSWLGFWSDDETIPVTEKIAVMRQLADELADGVAA